MDITKNGAEAMGEGAQAHCKAHSRWASPKLLTNETRKLRKGWWLPLCPSPPGASQIRPKYYLFVSPCVLLTAMADVISDIRTCTRCDTCAY